MLYFLIPLFTIALSNRFLQLHKSIKSGDVDHINFEVLFSSLSILVASSMIYFIIYYF